MAQIFVSGVAHFFVVVSGSKIHERLDHFFIDIYIPLLALGNLQFKVSGLLVFTNGLPINIAEIIIKNHIFSPKSFILYKYYNKNFI